MIRFWPILALTVFQLALAGFASHAQGTTLVALGDSYSSGEGAKPYDAETDRRGNRCHRSPQAWPRLLGAFTSHLLACSGAETRQLYIGMRNRDDHGQLAGLTQISERTTIDVVTVTLGGNDIGFAAHVRACFLLPSLCLADQEEIDRDLRDLRADLVRGYDAIQSASGGARLVVVGYPEIVPRPIEPDHCVWLSQVEKDRAAIVAGKLNRTIASAASAAGAEFISIRGALDNHELCTDDSWMRRIWIGVSIQEMGHPTTRGQEAIADAVRGRILPPIP
jgi:lysophospholipase L1-like esterase